VYSGRVVNITKFGAFVNILPGRDGLVHISKLGGGRRINAVEDVLSLGQELDVRVDEIDDKGKVSLTPVGDAEAPAGDGNGDNATTGDAAGDRVVNVSFEDTFDEELRNEVGDLGPDQGRERAGTGGDSRGGRGGRDRERRRHR
jgi:polyribonucleotide nucleotidyltransferase